MLMSMEKDIFGSCSFPWLAGAKQEMIEKYYQGVRFYVLMCSDEYPYFGLAVHLYKDHASSVSIDVVVPICLLSRAFACNISSLLS